MWRRRLCSWTEPVGLLERAAVDLPPCAWRPKIRTADPSDSGCDDVPNEKQRIPSGRGPRIHRVIGFSVPEPSTVLESFNRISSQRRESRPCIPRLGRLCPYLHRFWGVPVGLVEVLSFGHWRHRDP